MQKMREFFFNIQLFNFVEIHSTALREKEVMVYYMIKLVHCFQYFFLSKYGNDEKIKSKLELWPNATME